MAGTVYGSKYSLAALADMNGASQTSNALSDYADVSATSIILPDDFITTFGQSGSTTYEHLTAYTMSVTVASSGRFADNWYNDAQNYVFSSSGEYRCTVQINSGANARTRQVTATLQDGFNEGDFALRCYFYHSVATFLDITDYKVWNISVIRF